MKVYLGQCCIIQLLFYRVKGRVSNGQGAVFFRFSCQQLVDICLIFVDICQLFVHILYLWKVTKRRDKSGSEDDLEGSAFQGGEVEEGQLLLLHKILVFDLSHHLSMIFWRHFLMFIFRLCEHFHLCLILVLDLSLLWLQMQDRSPLGN